MAGPCANLNIGVVTLVDQSAEGRNVQVLTDTDNVHAAETDEELLIFDVSDDALERAAPAG
jgi:hypothetical protein